MNSDRKRTYMGGMQNVAKRGRTLISFKIRQLKFHEFLGLFLQVTQSNENVLHALIIM